EWCPDRTGGDGVDPDAAGTELGREVDGEIVQPRLRRGVVDEPVGGLEGLDRGGVDDARAGPEMWGGGLGEPEGREDVGGEGALDLLTREVLQRLVRHLEPGVVDEDVESAEL